MSTNEQLDAVSTFFVEAFAPDNRADPYELYRRMREHGPFVSSELEMHLAFGHADCAALLRHPAASSDERHSTVMQRMAVTDERIEAAMTTRPLLVFMDPPDHTRLRGLVAQGFTPRRVEQLRASMQTTTNAIVDGLATRAADGDDEIDLIEELAYPLPITVICELLGVASTDHSQFRLWSDALTRTVDPGVLRTPDDEFAIAVAMSELRAYTAALLSDRRTRPGSDLLSDLIARRDGDHQLGDDELVDLVVLLLVAGHETTVNLIGNGVVALLDHPDQLAAWARQPELGSTAIDELLRFDSPLQMVQRVAVQPIRLGELTIPAGDQVIVMLGGANRDPALFDDPGRLDIHRPNANRHLSFGGGVHHCLGAALAKAEGDIAITSLLARFPDLTAAGEATIRARFTLRGRDHLPVSLGRPTASRER